MTSDGEPTREELYEDLVMKSDERHEVSLFDEETNVQMKADAIFANRRVVRYFTENYEWTEGLQTIIDVFETQTKLYEEELGLKRCTHG